MIERTENPFLDINGIREKIPHRYPFLLIDRIESFIEGPDPKTKIGNKVIATKNVTANEPFFTGHFPHKPVMPGVMQIEAMAQAGDLACTLSVEEPQDVLVAKFDNAKFRRPVVPGDILEIHAEIMGFRHSLLSVKCKAFSFGSPVSQVDIMAKFFPRGTI